MIGWDQITKDRISTKWLIAQHIYLQGHSDLRRSKYQQGTGWTVATIKSFVDICIGMWNDICNILHGVDEKDRKRKIRQRITKRVEQMYRRGEIHRGVSVSI